MSASTASLPSSSKPVRSTVLPATNPPCPAAKRCCRVPLANPLLLLRPNRHPEGDNGHSQQPLVVRRIYRLGASEKDERVYKNAHPKRLL